MLIPEMSKQIDMEKALQVATTTIRMEIEALEALYTTIQGQAFQYLITMIASCKGRVVVSGIGKSAIIAQKIVATFNSTGTPSLFMHAADATHGDLGIITDEDIVIVLSKSGGTPEIRTLVRFLKHMKNKLVAITCEADSFLASNADYVLVTPYKQEADPNNLAPTTSSTAQLALGDALAMALIQLKGFEKQDFARFHPGGSLGKQLYLKAGDMSSQHDCPSVGLGASIREVILEISSKRLGASVVLDTAGKIKGIITDGDLRRMLNQYTNWEGLHAEDIMTKDPKSVQFDTLAVEALSIMRKYSITQLPVIQNDTYAGMVHLHDLLSEGLVTAS